MKGGDPVRRLISILLLLCLALPVCTASASDAPDALIEEDIMLDEPDETIPDTWDVETVSAPAETSPVPQSAREDFINRIISMGEELYLKANGKAQRAHYKGDIYVCKNFTTHLFRENRADFCMAEYPDVKLVIPDNLPKEACRPYAYGICWKDIPASKGNPFYEAASFRYDSALSREENLEKAKAFLRLTQRGDFFQLTGDYGAGVGAHSAIMLGYDEAADEIHWMDSNFRKKKIKGINYGYVQFDEARDTEWWAVKFCQKKCGATLYRLREDIIYVRDAAK